LSFAVAFTGILEFAMDWLETQFKLMTDPKSLVVLEIVLFCAAIFLSVLDCGDYDMYTFVYASMALYLFGALICGGFAWKSVSKGFKVACGVIMLLSAVLLPQDLWWCWNNALHPPHYREHMALQSAADNASEKVDAAKAEQLYKTIMEKEKSGWFPRHSFNDLKLADALEQQKKFKEAEQVYLQALHTMEQAPPNDPRNGLLVTCVQNLAIFYQDQKRYADAEPLFKRALQLHKRSDGTWEAMLCREDYARLLRETGRASEAKPLEQEAKAIRGQFPPDQQK
jgi:tetratricopeptide (TPR) repeat protein